MATETVPAPDRIFINGVLAYAPGDPVPIAAARKLAITGKRKNEGPIYATADETGITSAASEEPPPEGTS
jgi:hypothetical protein